MSLLRNSTIFCSVCSTERAQPTSKIPWTRLAFTTVLWSGLLGAVAAMATSVVAAMWVSVASGVLCFGFLEVYYSAKLKRELICPVCHFDPVLYRRSPEEAKQRCLDSLKLREDIFSQKWQALKNPSS